MQGSSKPTTVSTADGVRHRLKNNHATVCMIFLRYEGEPEAVLGSWQERLSRVVAVTNEPPTCLWCWSIEGVWPQALLP